MNCDYNDIKTEFTKDPQSSVRKVCKNVCSFLIFQLGFYSNDYYLLEFLDENSKYKYQKKVLRLSLMKQVAVSRPVI